MRRGGYADLPLHGGDCPKWLFGRMVKLSRAITEVIVEEYSQGEYLKRLCDPFWFQAFSCAIAFDWHSSGVTTTLTGALKEAVLPEEMGIAVCGGKGKTSKKTPQDIEAAGELFSLDTRKIEELKKASRLAAKVDNAAVQDGFNLYHHCLVMSEKGDWIVIQQGMNGATKYARRYHWLGESVKSFVEEPHHAICCDSTGKTLNMVAGESEDLRKACVDLSKENPDWVMKQIRGPQKTLDDFDGLPVLHAPRRHDLVLSEDVNQDRIKQILVGTYENNIGSYEELLGMQGVGPATVRSLALISELIYGEEPSWRDPCRYSFCLGGKDGFPYQPKLEHYDEVIDVMKNAISQAKLGDRERLGAIKRLNEFAGTA